MALSPVYDLKRMLEAALIPISKLQLKNKICSYFNSINNMEFFHRANKRSHMGLTSHTIGRASWPSIKNGISFSDFPLALGNWLFWGHVEVNNDLDGFWMWETLEKTILTLIHINFLKNLLRKTKYANPSILLLHSVFLD